jgi:hypothetical protein
LAVKKGSIACFSVSAFMPTPAPGAHASSSGKILFRVPAIEMI